MKRKLSLICIAIILLLAILYLTFAYAPFTANLRQIYVETAMGTLHHQWLAEKLLPKRVVTQAMANQDREQAAQTGLFSRWDNMSEYAMPEIVDEGSFFEVFHELPAQTVHAWLAQNPNALQNGWENLYIAPEKGDTFVTRYGEPVLVVDAANKLLLVETETTSAKGILAIIKNPAGLSVCPSSALDGAGETVGKIAKDNGGLVAITGSAFHGANEEGTGGQLAGYAMCSGVEYGSNHLPGGNKRIEYRKDQLLYITDTTDPVSADCTDAVEFRPALIIDGQLVVEKGWAGLQPRTCLGQTGRREILMLVMEGRILSEGILGASVLECARVLKQHGCMQAINLDGGNSAMLWYNGAYLTRSCDPDHKDGRPVPTAVVWKNNK